MGVCGAEGLLVQQVIRYATFLQQTRCYRIEQVSFTVFHKVIVDVASLCRDNTVYHLAHIVGHRQNHYCRNVDSARIRSSLPDRASFYPRLDEDSATQALVAPQSGG